MINLFNSVVQSISLVIQFIGHTISSLIVLITQIPTYINFLLSSITFMPVLVNPFIVASLACIVMLFIVNRGA